MTFSGVSFFHRKARHATTKQLIVFTAWRYNPTRRLQGTFRGRLSSPSRSARDRQRAEFRIFRIHAAFRSRPFPHHDVHQHDAQIRITFDDVNRLPSIRRADDFHLVIFQNRRECENVPRVIVHTSACARATLVGIVQRASICCSHPADSPDAMQEQRCFVEQSVRDWKS